MITKEQWDKFWTSSLGVHLKSFIKTYITVFITVWLALYENQPVGSNIELFSLTALAPAAKWAFISVLRNVYSILEKK